MTNSRNLNFADSGDSLVEDIRKAILSHREENPDMVADPLQDILTFLRAAGQVPTPVQQFVLKLIYKLPLDSVNQTIKVWDRFKEKLRANHTEVEFFQYLVDRGRINLPAHDHHLKPDVNIWNIVCPWGRRGSKSAVAGFIVAYEVYQLLHFYSPHDFFGIIDTEEIRVMSISTTVDQAETVRGYALACIDGHQFFRKYVLRDRSDSISFATQKMLDRGVRFEEVRVDGETKLRERPGIVLATYPCSERRVRGKGNIVLVYDELAHFLKVTGSVTGDEAVVNAASPSQARFHKNGRIYAKTISISDPLDEAGEFYKRYKDSWEPESQNNTLMVRLPTVEANPDAVTTEYLKAEFKKMGEKAFKACYEAEFTMGVTSFMEDPSWFDCFSSDHKFHNRSAMRVWYYCGVDLGFVRDKTAISVVHRTNDDRVVQDYLRVFWPEEYENDQALYDDIVKSLKEVWDVFQPRYTVTDQHEGRGMVNACAKFGMKLELIHMTEYNHSAMAKLFRSLLRSNRFTTSSEATSFREELVYLRKIERGRDIIRVEKSSNSYDDEYDATVRAVWGALEIEQFRHRGVEHVKNERRASAHATAVAKSKQNQGFNVLRRKAQNGGFNRWGQRRR